MANTALGRNNTDILTNKSGGAVAYGDVVVVDLSNAAAFTTTTSSGYSTTMIGVVIEPNGIANNAAGMVAFNGPVPQINLASSASLGDFVKCHTVAKQGTPHAAPMVTGDFAEVKGTGTTPKALLFGKPHLATASSTIANSNISPTTTNVSAAANTRYFADVSGLTANRNFVLPTATVGDVIELNIKVGDDTYALVVIGDTGVSINGGSTATEWSRLFNTGETVTLVADTTSNWQVVRDGRIPCRGLMTLSAAETTNTADTDTLPTWDNKVIDVGNLCDTTNYRFNLRRAGNYKISGSARPNTAASDQKYYYILFKQNTTSVMVVILLEAITGTSHVVVAPPKLIVCAATDAFYMYFHPEESNRGMTNAATYSWFQIEEAIP